MERQLVPGDVDGRPSEAVVCDEGLVVARDGVGRRGHAERLAADGDGVLLDGLDAHAPVQHT